MAAAGDPTVEIRVLGPVEASVAGRPVSLGGRRQRVLLALLVLQPGQPASPDWLVEEVWAGEPTGGADATIRSYVSRLRDALDGIAITGTAAGYAIEVDPAAIDAHRFEALVKDGDAALARRAFPAARDRFSAAIALWRGRPFGGLADDGALRIEADRLEELRLHAVEQLIDAQLQLGVAAELVHDLDDLTTQHPLRERLWRHLMLALYRSGRQADALAAYRRAREILDEQLGLEPGEELRALEIAILRQEVPPVVPAQARHNLPAPLTSFIGRVGQLAEVGRLLSSGRLVTLTGVGGVGKTRLALEVAREAIGDHPDGVAFIDLAPISNPAQLPDHVGTVLEIREQSGVSLVDGLIAALRDRDQLLVLDNCEHVRAACADLIARLLADCPGLTILATSRETLGVPGERDFPVPPLGVPSTRADAAEALESEAVQLLLARARDARPRPADSDEAIASARQIVADLDGLPLAIELAAARTKALSLAEIATRLDDRFRFLVSWRRLTAARHRTLREAMDWSYSLLQPDEQEVFARLSVFVGGFTGAAVAAVALGGDEDQALRLVERLIDASLVAPVDAATGTRYRMLETVRQYAAEKLADAGLTTAAMQAHAAYYAALAEATPTTGAEQLAGLAVLDAESGNIRIALDRAAAFDEVGSEQRLAGAMWRFWWIRGRLAEGRARLEGALARDRGDDPAVRRKVLYGAAGLAWTAGDYARGESAARELLEAAEVATDGRDRHRAHNLLAVIAMTQHRYDVAEAELTTSMRLAHELGNELDEVVAKMNLGVNALNAGRVAAAVPILDEVLAFHRRTGNTEGVAFASLNLGEAAVRLGDVEQAREHFDVARATFDSLGFRVHVGHATQGLAAVAERSGDFPDAARLLGLADAHLAEVGASDESFAPELVARTHAAVAAALDPETFRRQFEAGRNEIARA